MRVGIIMAGGVGERFWPYSRALRPKQLLKIVSGKSLLQESIERVEPLIPLKRIFIATTRQLKGPILRELPFFPAENIICEPMGRNTAACLALAEAATSARFPDATMAVLTADHVINGMEAFRNNLDMACSMAEEDDCLVTLGIKPTRPETGFGYIEAGEVIVSEPRGTLYRVARFMEKPDATTAEQFIKAGTYYWNSGMFFWKNRVLREHLERYLPKTYEAMNRYRAAIGTPKEESVLNREFEGLEKISIDYAVMEKAPNVKMLRAEFGWDDLETWDAVGRRLEPDASGNQVVGRGLLLEDEDCLIYNPEGGGSPLVTAYGLKDTLIVVDRDVVMVCPKSKAPELKKLVQELKNRGMDEYL
ncbi:MAG TPA: mannose-1-phosphate guanylyltransferase [Candidatus Sumerlaeota bacterium]|nr:mannose-1-phosphate guanylyltransferase [Candidatus Sumerlaeota bacterium]